jgi:hypothetical protein
MGTTTDITTTPTTIAMMTIIAGSIKVVKKFYLRFGLPFVYFGYLIQYTGKIPRLLSCADHGNQEGIDDGITAH